MPITTPPKLTVLPQTQTLQVRAPTPPPGAPTAATVPPPPPPPPRPSGLASGSSFKSTASPPKGSPVLAPSRKPAEGLARMDESQLLKSRSGTERSGLGFGGPPPPPPPPESGLPTPSAVRPPAPQAPAATPAPVSLSGLQSRPNSGHVQITYDQFQKLMASPKDRETLALQKRIHSASFPTGKNGVLGSPLPFRLDVTGVPGKKKGTTEQLSISFEKVGSNVRMRAYQGNTINQGDHKALIDVTFFKPQAGQTNTAKLEWVGNRDEDNPANLTGGALIEVFKGIMNDSNCTCSLEDVSGKMLDSKRPEESQVKFKLTGAYAQGGTWYMQNGARPKDEAAWNEAAGKLSKLKVSDVQQELGQKCAETSPSSGMTMQRIIDAAAPHIAAASKGKYKNAQDVKDNMPLGDFYRTLSNPDVLEKLQGTAEKHGTSATHMAYDFYSLALERNMAQDPNEDLKKAVATIKNQSGFHFDFSSANHG